jgi:hypothetical protein
MDGFFRMNESEEKRPARARRRFGFGCCLILLVGCWFWLEESSFHVKGTLGDFSVQEVADSEEGEKPSGAVVFSTPAPPVFAGLGLYSLSSGPESDLKVFEDGELMYRVSRFQDLDAQAYVHLQDRVCLVLFGDSDPRTNGRVYTYRARYHLRLRYQGGLGLLIVLAGVGLGLVVRGQVTVAREDGDFPVRRGRWEVLLDSRALLLLVAFAAPFLSFLGRNSFYYPYRALGVSAGGVLVLAVGGTLILKLVEKSIERWGHRVPGRTGEVVRVVPDVLWVGLACAGFVSLCGFVIGDVFSEQLPGISSLLFCAFVLASVTVAWVLRFGVRVVNLFLLSFLVVAGGTFLVGFLGENKDQEVAAPLPGDPEIRFATKPNIYLFLLESYAGSDAMREFYGIDASRFYQRLRDRGFQVRDTYSNQIFSIGSASSLMMMRHLDVAKWSAGLFDTQRGVRAMLCGAAYNPVLDVLKRNGYRISFLQRDYYLYPQPSPAVDETNLPFNDTLRSFQPLVDATGVLAKKTLANSQQRPLEQLDAEIRKGVEKCLDQPTFHFIYTGLEHNMPREANSESRARWKVEFRNLRSEFNPRFIKLLDFIEARDPNALIVLIGDHGSKLFGHDFTIDSPGYPALARSGVCTPETVARDQASVLFAIKTPVPHPVWENRVVTHVNLFRYLFATLSRDESLLDHPEPDVSMVWTGRHVIARDGRPLLHWEPIPPELFPSPGSGEETN